jgi:hypothetical protein
LTKLLLVLAATVAATVALAAPASADPVERRCTTPHVAGFNSFEVCYYLPVLEG